MHMQSQCTQDLSLFSFVVSLPQKPDPYASISFCFDRIVQFQENKEDKKVAIGFADRVSG